MNNENQYNEETLKVMRDACLKVGLADGKLNEQGEFQAYNEKGEPLETNLRIIEDVQGELEARVIKEKKSGTISVLLCNIPKVEDIISRGGIVSEFINKYFASNYARKLINNKSITKLADLLTPQSGSTMVANPLTKPFNGIVKIVASCLKVKCPNKSKIINEQAVKLFLVEEQLCNLTCGKITVKDKEVDAYNFIVAIIKQQLIKNPDYVGFTLEDVLNYAVELNLKAKTQDINSNIDEDELDI